MRIEIPYPPTANTYWRRSGHRIHLSNRGRAYKQTVAGICMGLMSGRSALDGNLSVELYLNPPDKRRRDADNLAKPVLDALTAGGVWCDDCQVKRLLIEMGEPVRGGHAIVTVDAIGD